MQKERSRDCSRYIYGSIRPSWILQHAGYMSASEDLGEDPTLLTHIPSRNPWISIGSILFWVPMEHIYTISGLFQVYTYIYVYICVCKTIRVCIYIYICIYICIYIYGFQYDYIYQLRSVGSSHPRSGEITRPSPALSKASSTKPSKASPGATCQIRRNGGKYVIQ